MLPQIIHRRGQKITLITWVPYALVYRLDMSLNTTLNTTNKLTLWTGVSDALMLVCHVYCQTARIGQLLVTLGTRDSLAKVDEVGVVSQPAGVCSFVVAEIA